MMDVEGMARAAQLAARALRGAPDKDRCAAVEHLQRAVLSHSRAIEEANAADVAEAERRVEAGALAVASLQRLWFRGARLRAAAQALGDVAQQPDPVGRVLRAGEVAPGLILNQVTVPLGVVACAFESRPDVVLQVAALAVRSGNAALLKGGAEAGRTNRVLVGLAQDALGAAGLPRAGVQGLESREDLLALLALDDLVDLVVPRGSSAFVQYVRDHTRIPVLGHAEGVCHTYVDRHADLGKALEVCVDAKTEYPAACNATECFLVHRDVAAAFVPALVEALTARDVEVRADAEARTFAPMAARASDEDWGREFGTLICAVRIVGSVEEAIAFITAHGSGHTDAILTRHDGAARAFVQGVDSAGVFVNASTRFSDGHRYGLGAEVGISTGKLHARGPVGLEGLTTTKWVLYGDGHCVATHGDAGLRPFHHEQEKRGIHG